MGKTKSLPEQFEIGFLIIGFASLGIALIGLLIWTFTNWTLSYLVPMLHSSGPIALTNGQVLEIVYPDLIIADETPREIKLIVQGIPKTNPNKPVELRLSIPSGLNVVRPGNQKNSKTIFLEILPNANGMPVDQTMGLVNARISPGWPWAPKIITVNSPDLAIPLPVYLKAESKCEAGLRDFISLSVNEKSPVILLATGLLSLAWGVFNQYAGQKRKEQEEKDKRDQNEIEKEIEKFRENLKKEPFYSLNWFVRWRKNEIESEGEKNKEVRYKYVLEIELFPWEELLIKKTLDDLNQKNIREAMDTIDIALDLNQYVIEYHHSKHSNQETYHRQSQPSQPAINNAESQTGQLNQEIPKTSSIAEKREAQTEQLLNNLKFLCALMFKQKDFPQRICEAEIKRLLEIYLDEPSRNAKSIIIKILESQICKNHSIKEIEVHFGSNPYGRQALRACDIYQSLKKITDPKEDEYEAAKAIKAVLMLEQTNWNVLWPEIKSDTSEQITNWLMERIPGVDKFENPFGPENGELDSRLADYLCYEHPILKKLKQAVPLIIYGKEGTGKTTLALRRAIDWRKPDSPFMVQAFYLPFDDAPAPEEWLFHSLSNALLEFVVNNPRIYLNTKRVNRTALGKFILLHPGQLTKYKLMMHYSSDFSNEDDQNEDRQHVLDELLEIYAPPYLNAQTEELADLLCRARLENFKRIEVLIDVQSTQDPEKQARQISNLLLIGMTLARRDIYLKIFIPEALKNFLGEHTLIPAIEITWPDSYLKELLDTRTEHNFRRLCKLNQFSEEPEDLIVKAANGSPRRLVELGNALLCYAERQLQTGAPLDKAAFKDVGIL